MSTPVSASAQPPFEAIVAASAATPEFKEAAQAFRERGPAAGSPLIRFNPVSPPVKVLRILTALLHQHPDWAVAGIEVEGFSGCSDYAGRAVVVLADGARRHVEFHWDCAWKARELGWHDAFGFPDQIRAARTFDWNCIRNWRIEAGPEAAAS